MNHNKLHELISEQQPNICEVVANKDGKYVYSDYWNGFQPEDTLHVMSVTKSIVSLLIGIAIDRGLIQSVDQKVLEFFPDYTVKRGEKTIQEVTIRHLLTMTAPYKYRYEPWSKICSSDDWTKAALDVLGGRSGITGEYKYSTLGIHILTGILAKVSELTTVDFANRYLFTPLGIAPYSNYEALTVEEHKEFILSKEPKKNIWFCDPKGVGSAGFGLCMSANTMVKIGQLCLDGGTYQGKQLISENWIRESTSEKIHCIPSFADMSYGYLWWRPVKDTDIYAALGNSGNVIYINPHKNMVVAVNGTFKPNILDRVQFIQEHIEPIL